MFGLLSRGLLRSPETKIYKVLTNKMKMNKFLEAVEDLNQELYEKVGEIGAEFSYSTNGYVDIVNFGEIMIWNSEMDEREWIEEKDDYEPLKPFLKRILSQEIDKLIEVKNAFNTKE